MAAASTASAEELGAIAPSDEENSLLTHAQRFQQKLLNNPADPEALVAMSLIALASRQADAAVVTALAATASAPEMLAAWVTLGHALRAQGNEIEAEAALNKALSLDSMSELALVALGEFKCAAGQADAAIPMIARAVQCAPEKPNVYIAYGHALACAGRFDQALEAYQHASALAPKNAEAHFAAGYSLMRLYKTDEAERAYRRALFLHPDFAAAWLNLGQLLYEQGRVAEAEAALRRSVELMPKLATGWVNLANLERDRGCTLLADEFLRRAMDVDPARVETLVALAHHANESGRRAAAWVWIEKALDSEPVNPDALNTRGILLHGDNQHESALVALAEAEQRGSFSAISNRGNVLLDMHRCDEALVEHRRAVARDPHHAGARYNLALTELRMGEWRTGWRNYEARWRFRDVNRVTPQYNVPRWTGEPLDGKTILLHAEQGLGDTMQFSRYAPLVAARGGRVLLQVQPAAARLMHSLAAAHSGAIQVITRGNARPDFDLECPLMSLPACFHTTVETAPWFGPYLGAEPEEVERRKVELNQHFGNDSRALRVGISWAGNPRYKADAARSMPLENFFPLLRSLPDAEFISLQKGDAAEQLRVMPRDLHIYDGSSRDRDFAATAALTANLDLVLSTDTAVAHLAGAMGLPVWLLLAHHADWRWMEHRTNSPWYPTMRLLRQASPGAWTGLLNDAAVGLENLNKRI